MQKIRSEDVGKQQATDTQCKPKVRKDGVKQIKKINKGRENRTRMEKKKHMH